jgi:tetratricopeptide (TPR) repeat protein/TolB-like protein
MIGRMVGRYRVVALLGRGGMGEVWKAEDTLLGRHVALKFLPEAFDEHDRRRFDHGLIAAAVLSDPGIAQLYNKGVHEGRPYGVFAFVDGETLSQVLERGPIPIHEAIRIVIAAARALGHAHRNGVIHRDVKSSNVMLTSTGKVVVVDFGLASREGLTRITESGTALGTAAYWSPEAACGHAHDARSDLYSLGVLLFELLTGTLPFSPHDSRDLPHLVLHEPPPRPSDHRSGLSESVDRVVLRAMEKEPRRRYQSADELISDLETLLRDDSLRPEGRKPETEAAIAIPPRLPERKYILVPPFRVVAPESSPDVSLELVGSGLAEALCVALGRLPSVIVFPPSVLSGDAIAGDMRALAARTGANLALTGTLRRGREGLVLSWSLLAVATGMQVGGDSLTTSVADPFEVETGLVFGVAKALGLASQLPTSPQRENVRYAVARERYLQALGHLRRYDNEASVNEAIAILDRLISTDSGVAAYHAALGRACLQKQRLTGSSVWTNRAANACERALTLDPAAPEVVLALGEVRNATGQHEAAEAAFRSAIQFKPEWPDAWVGLSLALEGRRRLDEAEAAARRAVAVRSDHWPAYNRLGILFFRQSRYDLAVEAWREVVRLSPDNARGWYNLGAAYFRSDRIDDALLAYQRSLDIRPTAPAYAGRGNVLFYTGRVEESVEMFEKAVALTPEDPSAWGNLGSTLRGVPGREEEGRAHLERGVLIMRQRLESNPRHAESWGLLGNWLAHLGDLAEARSSIERARELDPEDGAHMVRAAYVAALMGDVPTAQHVLNQARDRGYGEAAIRRDPTLSPLLESLDLHSNAEVKAGTNPRVGGLETNGGDE